MLDERMIFRGMEKEHKPFLKKKVRLDNRNPMSSAQIKHERYNNFFEEMFGEPFRNSLFVTGDYGQASHYGNIYMVVPIGHFDWMWSPDINDLALDIPWPSVGGHINVPPSQDTVDTILGNANYTINSNLGGAIQSGNEIMIRCDEYYAIAETLSSIFQIGEPT